MFVFVAVFIVGCAKDNIVLIDPIETDDSEDLIANTVFTQMVGVVFSTDGNATVTGTNDDFTASVNGNGVTIVYSGEEHVMYELSGTTNNGFFKLYSASKQGITLKNASITNPNGAAINVQGPTAEPSKGKRTFIVLDGENSLADGNSYTDTPAEEDEKAALFGEGQFIFSGTGSLAVTATGKSGIVSDDYIHLINGTVTVNVSSSVSISGDDTLKPACVKGKDYFKMTGGTLNLINTGTGGKGISSNGNGYFYGGMVTITVTGSNFGSSGGSGAFPGGGGNSDSNGVSAKGIKCDGNLVFKGSKVVVNSNAHEGIEAKGTLSISGGEVYSHSQSDDAINSGSNLTISGGLVCAYSQGNDGLDANGNCYIKGGVVYAIGSNTPEVAVDANSEGGYKLYLTGGTLVAIGGLESGSSLTQNCYSASSWSQNTWYGLTVGPTTYAFKTPSSGGTPLVVSGDSTPTLQSGISVSGGTTCFEELFYTNASVSGGSSVSLSSYTGGNGNGGGPGGGGPGGGHGPF